MAKFEIEKNGDIDQLAGRIQDIVLGGSTSASLEDSSYFGEGGAQCRVLVFERYSFSGGNRVSLNVTLFQNGDGPIQMSAITAGGSQATFFKINTIGEEAFLDKLLEIL